MDSSKSLRKTEEMQDMEKKVLVIMPGLVARVTCEIGDQAKKGDLVAVLNVMKQEMEVRSLEEGTVKEWDEMDVDTPMIILEYKELH